MVDIRVNQLLVWFIPKEGGAVYPDRKRKVRLFLHEEIAAQMSLLMSLFPIMRYSRVPNKRGSQNFPDNCMHLQKSSFLKFQIQKKQGEGTEDVYLPLESNFSLHCGLGGVLKVILNILKKITTCLLECGTSNYLLIL